MTDQIIKPLAIALMLALVPVSIPTAQAANNKPTQGGGQNTNAYKIGDVGPGGGFIFFVDYSDQYPNFTYLEAAPTDASTGIYWCDNTTTSIAGTTGWAANAVGRGRANTDAMLAVCSSGAANVANSYSTSSTIAGDWFLPSVGEAMLMYTNLRQAGVGGFTPGELDYYYWTSTEMTNSSWAWIQRFTYGTQDGASKDNPLPVVRAIRAF